MSHTNLLEKLEAAAHWVDTEAEELGLIREDDWCVSCEVEPGAPHAEECPALIASRHSIAIKEAIRWIQSVEN